MNIVRSFDLKLNAIAGRFENSNLNETIVHSEVVMYGQRVITAKTAEWLSHRKIIFVLFLAIVVTKSSAYDFDNWDVPCKFLDSINITGGTTDLTDGSITFDGYTFPKELHAIYDYEFLNESFRQPVAPHPRGCICALNPLKPCIRMCCPRGKHFRGNCIDDERVINVTVSIDNTTDGNVYDHFNYVWGKPCSRVFRMDPEKNVKDAWVLFKVSKREICHHLH